MKLSTSFRALCLLAAVSALPLQSSHAALHSSKGPFGLGIVLGEPSGLSAKYWLSSRDALDFGLAYSFNNYVAFFADYLFHFPSAFSGQKQPLSDIVPYIGVGAIFFADTDSSRNSSRFFTTTSSAGLGLRIPFGLEWRPGYPPLGVFLELVPGIGIIPNTFGFLDAGIGIRFYF